MKNDKFEEFRLKIRNWLMQRHYTMQNVSEAGKAWVIVAIAPDESAGFAVSMDLGEPDIIGFGVTLPLDDWQASLNSLPAKERKEFLYDVRFRLANLKVNCPISLDNLPSVVISGYLYAEELTRPIFWERVAEIYRAIAIILWSFEKQFLSDSNKPFTPPIPTGNH